MRIGNHAGLPLRNLIIGFLQGQPAVVFRIVRINRPVDWIVFHIFTNGVQFVFVTNDALVIIALENLPAKWFPSELLDPANVFIRRHRFEPVYHVTQCWTGWGKLNIKATTRGLAYADDDDTVNVVRHYDKGVWLKGREFQR
jgi:hypothetical protein